MPRTPDAQSGPDALAKFSMWARRVVDHIRDDRGWSVREITRQAGVARSIIYRWIDGEITKAPEQETIDRFCDNLGVPKDEPYALFGWAMEGRTEIAPIPLPKVDNPDLVAIQRILDEHDLSGDDVFMIQSILKTIRDRYSPPDSDNKRAAG